MLYRTTLAIFALCLSMSAFAQTGDTLRLEGLINNSVEVRSGEIALITGNVKILPGSELAVNPGATILFQPGAQIVVEGGLKVNGIKGSEVRFKSMDDELQGFGVLIRGNDLSSVEINHAQFLNLLTPIEFGANWLRQEVVIQNSLITGIETAEPGIIIKKHLPIQNGQRLSVRFSKNVFSGNQSNVYVELTNDPGVQYDISDNIFQNNVYASSDWSNKLAAPLVIYAYDNTKGKSIKGNSFRYNYQIINDSIKVERSISIDGAAEQFQMGKNYWGEIDASFLHKSLIHFFQDNLRPQAEAAAIASEPGIGLPIHVYNIEMNGVLIRDLSKIPNRQLSTWTVGMELNRPVSVAPALSEIQYRFYQEGTGKHMIVPIKVKDVQLLNGGTTVQMKMSPPPGARETDGYLAFPDMAAGNQTIPGFKMGDFVRELTAQKVSPLFMNILGDGGASGEGNSDGESGDENSSEKPGVLLGLSAGPAIYNGDLNASKMGFLTGFSGRLQMNKKWFVSLDFATGKLYGASETNSESFDANLSFENQIVTLGIGSGYQIVGFSKDKVIINAKAGVQAMHFDPWSKWNGYNYRLQPFTTEGQEEPYSLWTVNVPVGLEIFYAFEGGFQLGVNASYNLTFTDYLDDVSGAYANYENELLEGEIAAYFSDPSRSIDGLDYQKTTPRGNPNNNDSWINFGITLIKKISVGNDL